MRITRKIRKHRGRKDCGGHKKKRRGAGSRGGRGKAGLSKHKWTWTVKNAPNYFKKQSMKSLRKKPQVINLSQINDLAKKESAKTLDLSDYKVLGSGELSKPITIKALSFSKKALEKINKIGGKAEGLIPEPVDESASEKAEQSETVQAEESTPVDAEQAKESTPEKAEMLQEDIKPEKSEKPKEDVDRNTAEIAS